MLSVGPRLEAGRPLRLLCLGAHCDDIEIGAGGTVVRLLSEHPGTEVTWVVFASTAARAAEAQASAAAFLEAAGTRRVTVHAYRDGFLPDAWAQVKADFEALKGEVEPDLVLTHHRRDAHQDHRVIAELTWNTFRDHLVLEYEIPKYDGDLGRPNAYIALSAAQVERKVALLLEHFPSQHARRWFDAETFRSLLRLRGMECNAPERYAEAFHSPKQLW